MRILFYATYPTQSTGYARIGNILTNYLAEHHEVYYMGISNFPGQGIQRFIHPNITLIDVLKESQAKGSTEIYGPNVICEILDRVKPDILVLYNDCIVICRLFNALIEAKYDRKFKTVVYLDLVYDFQKIELINHIDKNSDLMFVFTDHWKQNLMDMKINPEKIKILPHGFDDNIFYPINKQKARESFGFGMNDFVILNTNRNSYRKAIDITIEAFIKLLKMNNMDPKLKLFLNMNFQRHIGYHIIDFVESCCIKNNVDYKTVVNHHILRSNTDIGIGDDLMNKLYNATDVGINTCIGEGFGLCNMEHGALGVAQVVPNIGGLRDIFNDKTAIKINPIAEYYLCNTTDEHAGYVYVCSSDDFAKALDFLYKNPEKRIEIGKNSKEKITNEYKWPEILEYFNGELIKLYKAA